MFFLKLCRYCKYNSTSRVSWCHKKSWLHPQRWSLFQAPLLMSCVNLYVYAYNAYVCFCVRDMVFCCILCEMISETWSSLWRTSGMCMAYLVGPTWSFLCLCFWEGIWNRQPALGTSQRRCSSSPAKKPSTQWRRPHLPGKGVNPRGSKFPSVFVW